MTDHLGEANKMVGAARIRARTAKTEADRAAGDGINAAACAIRLTALRQALKDVEEGK